jgi:glycosyltransferase involved in cell wall biosynthesis
MRVLILSDFFPPLTGGVETHVAHLSAGLTARGHDVAVFTSQVDWAPAAEEYDRVRVVRAPSVARHIPGAYSSSARPWFPPFPDPLASAHLRRLVRSFRPDIVHGHDWLARSFLPLAIRNHAALVTTLHYYTQTCAKKSLMYRGGPCSGPAIRKCLSCAGSHYGPLKGTVVAGSNWPMAKLERARSDVIIAVSQFVADGNHIDHSETKRVVIPNFLAPNETLTANDHELLRALPDEPFVLFAGDLRRDKGIQVLFDAYRTIPDPPPLVLLGEIWPDTESEIPRGAVHLGTWTQAAVREAWRRCLFGVVPSIWPEAFGLVALECMAAGRPVIASRVGGIPEVVADGECGVLVSPGDPTALAAAMSGLLSDQERRARMGLRAAERAGNFSADVILPRIEAAYELALERRRSRTGRASSAQHTGIRR